MGNVYNMVGGGAGAGIKLAAIAITAPPTQTAYRPGQTFNPAGMEVTATYSNGATLVASGWTYSPSGALTEGLTSVTVIYTEGGVTAQATQPITVQKASLAIPAQSGALTYSGSAQAPTWANYDPTEMTLGGVTSATDAGSYNATFTLLDTVGTQWSDGTTAPKTVAWTIGQAQGSVTLDPSSLSITSSNPTQSVTVTRFGTGAITAQSQNTGTATASVSGNVVSVTGEANGSTTVIISAAADNNYTAASATLQVSVSFAVIYGAEWDGSASPIWSRTDAAALFTDPSPAVNNGNGSSPFDDILPWSGMTIVEDPIAGTLVQIPKYWYKWTQNGASLKLQVADGPEEGFFVSPAHADRGDGQGERDYVYVGRYHCSSAYKSETGQLPGNDMTRATARVSISNLGAEYWQYDFAMYWTIMMLYLVEYANWNSQATIGYGCSPSLILFASGLTDSMVYHTGTSAVDRTTYGCCQYRHIEGLWDNVFDWCDGFYFSGLSVCCIKNPNDFSDTSGGTVVGTAPGYLYGFVSGWGLPSESGFEYALYPTAVVDGSGTTYSCDYSRHGASYDTVLRTGGTYNNQTQNMGAFCWFADSPSETYAQVGCRLQKLP